jgi:hypothetical protein
VQRSEGKFQSSKVGVSRTKSNQIKEFRARAYARFLKQHIITNNMQVTKHQCPEVVNPVSENLAGSRYHSYVNHVVNEVLGEYPSYLWGGAVRDPIVRAKYGRNGETKDFDILVDDSQGRIDFRKVLKSLGDIFYTRLGSPKWRPENGLEIDIAPFSNATRLRNGEQLPISLDTALQSCEFTTSAIAYGLQDRAVYSCGALEGIDKQEIDLLYPEGEEAHILMCRVVLQSERLGFERGQKATGLIVEGYSPNLDNHIRRYMDYKGLEAKFEHVVEQLRQIKARAPSQ